MNFLVGDWIRQASKGVGQVFEVNEKYYGIHFVDHGRISFLKTTPLEAASLPSPGFAFAKGKAKPSSGGHGASAKKPPVPFANFVARFLGLFKAGFEEPFFDEDERRYKEKAAKLLDETLSEVKLNQLLAQ